MRKLAYCKECKKVRKINVELTIIAYWDADFGGNITGFGDVLIRCPVCYSNSQSESLTQEECDEILNAACKTHYT